MEDHYFLHFSRLKLNWKKHNVGLTPLPTFFNRYSRWDFHFCYKWNVAVSCLSPSNDRILSKTCNHTVLRLKRQKLFGPRMTYYCLIKLLGWTCKQAVAYWHIQQTQSNTCILKAKWFIEWWHWTKTIRLQARKQKEWVEKALKRCIDLHYTHSCGPLLI